MRKAIRIFDAVLAVICTAVMALVAFGEYAMPDEIITYGGEDHTLSSIFSYSNGEAARSVDFQSASPRKETLKVFRLVPVKTVTVTAKETQTVYVSGEAFGIKLYTDGVIVVGSQSVDTGGKKVNPAEEAGIEVGDIIISINNMKVFTSDDVTAILNDNNGKPYTLKVKRDGRYKTFTLTPAYSEREGSYKAGMWVRDSTAGIGTITFYNKEAGNFAALGHQINDVDTNEIMPMLDGEAVSAVVTKIQKASSGTTGSLYCDFEDYTIGRLRDNTEYGLYGSYSELSDRAAAYEVATKQEVEKGGAQMLSTIDASGPQLFSIEITHISYTRSAEQKDIIFKVTDQKLLDKTGGIVQGMSGSPIIQNGKLIGAVTHVIVNNPEKGYAIFAQTMAEKSNNE